MTKKENCVYCEIPIGQSLRVVCNNCGSHYHEECWEENRKCAINNDCCNLKQHFISVKEIQNKIYKDFRYSGITRRAIATLIDEVLILAIGAIMIMQLDFMGAIIYLVFRWLYNAVMESSQKKATIGKKIMKIAVVDSHGEKISFKQATKRHLMKALLLLIFLVGAMKKNYLFLSIFLLACTLLIITEEKQGVHDRITNSLVVRNIARERG